MSVPRRDANAPSSSQSSSPNATSVLDLMGQDDPLRQEMERLLQDNSELMAKMGGKQKNQTTAPSDPAPQPPLPRTRTEPETDPELCQTTPDCDLFPRTDNSELSMLREENAKLRARVEELEQMLEAMTEQTEEVWAEQQREYETLLEEKSDTIRRLNLEMQQLRDGGITEPDDLGEDTATARRELMALKKQLEQEQQQLQDDEQALMEQARQMELSMSKERVELARQRNELRQMHSQLQHEIEQAARGGDLRERLTNLQRGGTGDTVKMQTDSAKTGARQALPTQRDLSQTDGAQQGGSLLRRIFGK